MFQEQEKRKPTIKDLQTTLEDEHDDCVNLEWECEILKDEW